jgi:glycosyltransferase involved in cell wall biosynthesis
MLKKDEIISVITICYNSEKVIEKTIKSVFSQTFKNMEYVLIDGESNDNTIEVIKSYQKCFDESGVNYTWISEKDRGIYDAMNKGVAKSNGKWLLFLNSGDYLLNEAILEYIFNNYLRTANFEILTGRVNIVSHDYINMGYTHPNKKGNSQLLLKENCIAHQATFIHRDIFDRYGHFQNFKIMMDYEYWIRLLSHDVKFSFINDIIANFINNGVSSNRDNYLTALDEQLDILNSYGYISKYEKEMLRMYKKSLYKLKTIIRQFLGERISEAVHNNRLRRR